MNIKLTVEYLGTAFNGWQYQIGNHSVQGVLEEAILTLIRSEQKKHIPSEFHRTYDRIILQGSGRTDSGVHALKQVANFIWPDQVPFDHDKFLLAINAMTPIELVVHSAEIVPDEFNARLTPHIKCYQYTILNRSYSEGAYFRRGWVVREKLDVAVMIEAARIFLGQHDFNAFRAGDCSAKSSIRTFLLSEVTQQEPGIIFYTVYGKGFLKYMIRILTGTLVEIGKGKLTIDQLKQILNSGSRLEAGPTAPAYGLTLKWVLYGADPHTRES